MKNKNKDPCPCFYCRIEKEKDYKCREYGCTSYSKWCKREKEDKNGNK